MRQLKNFMKAKKPMWRCGECKCVTLQCWRDNDEFCNCGTSSEGLGVEYAFKNWNGTILKKGSIDEGATPKAPANPTREATAEYTYTFAGWDPEVGPISEDTVYTATYTSTVNQYTVTFVDEDGTTVLDEQTLDYGAMPQYAGETPTKEATAQYTYEFAGWNPEVVTVIGNATYTATYSSEVNEYYIEIESNDVGMGAVDVGYVEAPYGTPISAEGNVLTIGETTITATAGEGYAFSSWGTLPATVTGNLNITATFEAETPSVPTLLNSVIYSYDDEAGTIFYDEDSGVVFEGTEPPATVEDFTGYTDNARVKQMFGVGEASINLQHYVLGSINSIDEAADWEYSGAGGTYNYQFTSNAWTAIQTFLASDGGDIALGTFAATIATEYSGNGNSILTIIL